MSRYLSLLLLLCLACTQPATTEDNASQDQPTSDVLTPEEDAGESATVSNSILNDAAAADSEFENKEIVGNGPIVYVTNDGDKYHTADCRYSKTAHTIKLSQAKADGKTACGICKPNSTTGEKQMRCSVNTAEGKRCQRMTTDASGKCYQHRES